MQSESAKPPTRLWRIIQFPLIRIFIAFGFLFVAIGVAQAIASLSSNTLFLLLVSLLAIVLTYVAYWGYVRLIEKRAVSELSFPGAWRELGVGLLLGAGLITIVIAILWLLGYYQVTGVNAWSVLFVGLAFSLQSGFIEEVIFRGVIFRITEEWLGTWLGLMISALIFGALHMANPNATLMSGMTIALEAGLLLAAAYMVTRRLWFPIGIHIAWNYVQGNVFGVSVSGNEAQGLLQNTLAGPTLLTGGAFGAEASLIALVVCLAAFVIVLRKALQMGRLVQPFWRRAKDLPQG